MVRFPAQFALFLIADSSLFFWLIRCQAKLIADIKAGKMVAAK